MSGPPRDYRLERNSRWLECRRRGLLRRLGRISSFVDGSLVLIARRCGNTQHCHCLRGPKHINTYLTYKLKGKTQTLYIPVDLETQVRRWSDDYRKLKELVRQICDLQRTLIRRHVKERTRSRKL